MELPAVLKTALADAVEPRAADRLLARAEVLSALTDGGAVTFEGLVNRVLRVADVPVASHRAERLDLPRSPDGTDALALQAIDPTHPLLAAPRLRIAVTDAVAALEAEGTIVPSVHPEAGSGLGIPLHRQGTSWGETIRLAARPLTSDAYSLSPPLRTDPRPELLNAGVFDAQTAGVLGQRGARCLSEGLTAHRRGLHLAAANLLAAASEAAWYRVAERLLDADPTMRSGKLDQAVADDRTSEVLRLTAEKIREKAGRRAGTLVTEIYANAVRFRDLRNYGLHPREDILAEQEHAFTEAGCALLFMDAHRYLGHLARLADAAVDGITTTDPRHAS